MAAVAPENISCWEAGRGRPLRPIISPVGRQGGGGRCAREYLLLREKEEVGMAGVGGDVG